MGLVERRKSLSQHGKEQMSKSEFLSARVVDVITISVRLADVFVRESKKSSFDLLSTRNIEMQYRTVNGTILWSDAVNLRDMVEWFIGFLPEKTYKDKIS